MTDNRYDLESLLDEIRKKKDELSQADETDTTFLKPSVLKPVAPSVPDIQPVTQTASAVPAAPEKNDSFRQPATATQTGPESRPAANPTAPPAPAATERRPVSQQAASASPSAQERRPVSQQGTQAAPAVPVMRPVQQQTAPAVKPAARQNETDPRSAAERKPAVQQTAAQAAAERRPASQTAASAPAPVQERKPVASQISTSAPAASEKTPVTQQAAPVSVTEKKPVSQQTASVSEAVPERRPAARPAVPADAEKKDVTPQPSPTKTAEKETAAEPDKSGWIPISEEELLGTDLPVADLLDIPEHTGSGQGRQSAPITEADIAAPRKDLRSISRQLTGSFDLVPSDYTGEFIIGHPEEKKEEEPEEEIDFSREGAEEHPLFTERTASFNVIPQLDDDIVKTAGPESTEEYTRGELRLDDEKKASASQGILNIKESVDDNFRELFGDTVIVEHRDSRKSNRRRDRAEELVYNELSDDDDEREEDPDEIYETLSRRASSSIITAVIAAIASVVIIAFAYVTHMKGTGYDMVSSIVTAACLAVSVIANWKTVLPGLAGIFDLKPRLTSLVSFSSLLSIAEPVVSILTGSYPGSAYSAAVTSFALFMTVLGEMLKATRDLRNFRSVSENPQKHASSVVTDRSFVQMLSSGLSDKTTGVMLSRRTGYTDRFANYCDSDNIDFSKAKKTEPIVAAVCVLLGVISYFVKGLSVAESLRVSALAAAVSAPFMSFLMFELPIHLLQMKLNRLGAVVPGYSAAEDVASANSVVLEGRELFPREKVLLHGIKTFEKERIDQAILYAASVLIHSCDTMAHMFMKVIQGKTDMLFDTDSVVYEEGLGFSFWVDQDRILVGRREMLESHGIEVPSRDYENRYTKASTRDAIYLAVAGKLYAMFVIGYSPDEEMSELLKGLVKNDISIIVRTRDFIISPEKISRMYDVPQSMITMVRDSSMQELAKKTEYTRHCPSCLTHVGSVGAFLGGMIGCNDLLGKTGLSSIMGLVGMVIGILLAAVLALFGGLDTVKVTSVALYQVIWSVIHFIAILIMR
ncbi:MAG: hypothetical protein J5744_01410 [Oscillospiraceae bacterium]|nr:hypothetical protein [Oscillospiraceae bacterium]